MCALVWCHVECSARNAGLGVARASHHEKMAWSMR
jgi:hypothetical protein